MIIVTNSPKSLQDLCRSKIQVNDTIDLVENYCGIVNAQVVDFCRFFNQILQGVCKNLQNLVIDPQEQLKSYANEYGFEMVGSFVIKIRLINSWLKSTTFDKPSKRIIYEYENAVQQAGTEDESDLMQIISLANEIEMLAKQFDNFL